MLLLDLADDLDLLLDLLLNLNLDLLLLLDLDLLSRVIASCTVLALRGRADRRPSASRRVGPAVMRAAFLADDMVEVLVHHARFEQEDGGCHLGGG